MTYAVVTILDAEDPEEAWEMVAVIASDAVKFVGEPWSVPHPGGEVEYSVNSINVSANGAPIELWPA